MIELNNKKILITGASGSIGTAISLVLRKAGAYLYLSGTSSERLNQLASKLGENCEIKLCNLTKTAQIQEMLDSIETLDGIVCNAGITKDRLSIGMSEQDFQEVIDLNLKANFILNRESIKKMLKSRSGKIVNISSVVGISGNAGQSNYAASKAGLIAMSKSLALEVAHRGININVVAPGFIKSAMTENLSTAQKDFILNKIPQRRWGSPEEVANIVAFLMSSLSSYITGQTFHVNGGMLML